MNDFCSPLARIALLVGLSTPLGLSCSHYASDSGVSSTTQLVEHVKQATDTVAVTSPPPVSTAAQIVSGVCGLILLGDQVLRSLKARASGGTDVTKPAP